MRISSKKYLNTMIIFTRPQCNDNNIYISYNGLISKLSLILNNEDLQYFLPRFIPLSRGLYINVETFSIADCGTIIDYKYSTKLKHKKYIIYKIRCSINVYYELNYYQLLNIISPEMYYESKKNHY